MLQKVLQSKRVKRGIAFLTALFMTLAFLPLNELKAAGESPEIKLVRVGKTYDESRNLRTIYIEVEGSYLVNLDIKDVQYGTSGDGFKPLQKNTFRGNTFLQFELTDAERQKFNGSVRIGEIAVSFNFNKIPTITSVDKKTINVDKVLPGPKTGEDLVAQGTNLDMVNVPASVEDGSTFEFRGMYGKGGSYQNILVNGSTSTKLTVTSPKPPGEYGLQDLVFTKKKQASGGDPALEIKYTYEKQFRLIKQLSLSDLVMYPNTLARGDKINFEGKDLKNYDVYFVKDLSEPYTEKNKGKNPVFKEDVNDTNKLSVEVPQGLDLGTYYVVLAEINNGDIIGEKVVQKDNSDPNSEPEILTVVDASNRATIDRIYPNEGPSTGSLVELKGNNLLSLNIDGLKGYGDFTQYPTVGKNSITTIEEGKKLIVDYGAATYNGQNVNVKKEIYVIIGREAVFNQNDQGSYDLTFGDTDRLTVKTQKITDESGRSIKTPVEKDVQAQIKTIIINADGSQKIFTEQAEYKDGKFTFMPSSVTPEIQAVVPSKVQVEKAAGMYQPKDNILLAIKGKDFMVNRYADPDTGSTIVHYPTILIKNTNTLNESDYIIKLDKNYGTAGEKNKGAVYYKENGVDTMIEGLELEVVDAQGNLVEGFDQKDKGTTILVKLPKEVKASTQGFKHIQVVNPQINSTESGDSSIKKDAVQFVEVMDMSKIPQIEKVEPYVVTKNGQEAVAIEGYNFDKNVKVYIDGKEVTPITRDGKGTKITFKAPPRVREGITQLQVINPEGGIAVHDFRYIDTFTDPKITSFSPNRGGSGTLVYVVGKNFFKPNPSVTSIVGHDIYQLIGTRVLFDGVDINEYQYDATGKNITPKNYSSVHYTPLMREENASIVLADYTHSVILEGPSQKYYRVDKDAKDNILLFHDKNEYYTLKPNPTVDQDPLTFEAQKDNQTYTATFEQNQLGDTITINGSIFYVKTLYKVDPKEIDNNGQKIAQNIITGNQVKVLMDTGDRNELRLIVPDSHGTYPERYEKRWHKGEKWYSFTIENPDTERDTKTGQQGFYYEAASAINNPTITKISPDYGSVTGGYPIDIEGQNFQSNAQVFIAGIPVPAKDISINTAGTKITVKVPAYNGKLSDEKDVNYKKVPVVVVNKEGQNASLEEGFTYVDPNNQPTIQLKTQQGSAVGGDIVEIDSEEFKFFEAYDDINSNLKYDEGETYRDLNANGKWDSLANQAAWNTTAALDHPKYDKYYTSPILPKVFFGDQQAKIVEYGDKFIKVVTPPLPEGAEDKVNVYIINNDSGRSNTVGFTYSQSKPTIKNIFYSVGSRKGKDEVEIVGSDFKKSEILVYEQDASGTLALNKQNMPLVRFGEISNKDIPWEKDNSGRLDVGRTTVALEGSLTVEYDSNTKSLKLSAEERDQIFEKTYSYDISGEQKQIFVPIGLLISKKDNKTLFEGYELIRVQFRDGRVIVERGYAPQTELVSTEKITLRTPSYYTNGVVPVTAVNPDGGTAESKFEYRNPSSTPKIANLTKERRSPELINIPGEGDARVLKLTFRGGNTVSVLGDGFKDKAKIIVQDVVTIEPKDIEYESSSKITVTKMPAVPESAIGTLHRVLVVNEDGGIASSKDAEPTPLYIKFIKADPQPIIDKVAPDKGPSKGGTRVKIDGKEFSATQEGYEGKKLQVYIEGDQIPEGNVTVVGKNTIYVVMPPHAPGKVELKIENPDESVATTTFTYISDPKIISIVNPSDPTESTRINSISIDGNERIKLKGSAYQEGAKVIFNPKLKAVDASDTSAKDVIYVDGKLYTLEEGTDGTDVKLVNAETLLVTTPKGKMNTKGILIINPDGGASNLYEDIDFGLPEMSAPTGVQAQLAFDRYIKVNWQPVSGAKEYEVYVVVEGKQAELIGSTTLLSFTYQNLEPDTRYKFIVKAVGELTTSKPSQESNTVKTGSKVGPPNTDGGLSEKTKQEKVGNTAQVNIGTEDYDDKELVIDLTQGMLAGSKEVVVSIPAKVVSAYDARNITILGKDFMVKLNPSAFRLNKVKENANKKDAGVRFRVAPYNGSVELQESLGAKGQKTLLSSQYVLEANVFVGKDSTAVDYLTSTIQISVDFDSSKAKLRKLNTFNLNRYEEEKGTWTTLSTVTDADAGLIGAFTDRLGRHAVIGSRK